MDSSDSSLSIIMMENKKISKKKRAEAKAPPKESKEEENAEGIIDSLRLAGSAGQGLFMVDRELGQRVPGPAEE